MNTKNKHFCAFEAVRQCRRTILIIAFFIIPNLSWSQEPAKDSVRLLNEVRISDTYVGQRTPLTNTTLNHEQLDDSRTETSLPYIIELQPSVVATGENGKVGNTSFRLRGVDAARINVGINGITLNDAESQTVYWVNIPNLAGMANTMQLQRGVGASVGGSSSFGGALNIQTLNANSTPYGSADFSLGLWNTRQYGISAGSGITRHGFSMDAAYSGLTSDGFVRGGFCDHQSLFLSGGWQSDRSMLKAIVIIGSQRTGITWDGAYDYQLDADPRYNGAGAHTDSYGNVSYYPDESDNYHQRHYQLYFTHLLSPDWSLNAIANFTHGDGFYEQYADLDPDRITRKFENNGAITGRLAANYSHGPWDISFGQTMLYFEGDHFGHIIWQQDDASVTEQHPSEWYRNKGTKRDATTFAKINRTLTKHLNLYGDLQLRLVNYRIEGPDDDLAMLHFFEDNLFFNPKVGLNWVLNPHQRLYFVAGISQREPARPDIKENIKVAGDTVKAEAMLDIEAGYQYNGLRGSFAANAYAMLYKDQLTAVGALNSGGYALMENVDRSYRIGLELMGGYRFASWMKMDANLTLSSNKILDYTFDDFRSGVDAVAVRRTATTDLSFSPSVVGAAIATFEPFLNAKLQLIGKYVGAMYCDNTSRQINRQEAYFLLNLKAGYTWQFKGHREIEAQILVNNILNHHYRLSAWTADYAYNGLLYTDRAYYQQPGTNLTFRIAMKF